MIIMASNLRNATEAMSNMRKICEQQTEIYKSMIDNMSVSDLRNGNTFI